MRQLIALKAGADLDGFRNGVRRLIAAQVPPTDVAWGADDGAELFGAPLAEDAPPVSLPRAVSDLVELAVCHRDPERYALLYELIWRILHGERGLLEIHSDPLMHRLYLMSKAIRRDLHKMHAFVRFRLVTDADGAEQFIAWFEPDHYILEATANFFIERFRGMVWSIVTPIGALHWNRHELVVGPPGERSQVPDSDAFEAGWRGYYESVFNPARLNPQAMRTHMPKKYWRNLPEAAAIPDLIAGAPVRAREMIEREASMPTKRTPDKAIAAMADQDPKTLQELNAIIAASEPLVPGATRAVLGEGPIGADIAFVGEQPGDQEDLEGHPFVGPAGQLLDRAMAEVGIDRKKAYVTNAVKHFKFERRGKKRIHQKPTMGEVKHYRWWLMKELGFVQPRLVVALGGTAVMAMTGKAMPITKVRGPMEFDGFDGYVTVHPSYLLRLPDAAAKQEAYRAFLTDLRRIRDLAAEEGPRRKRA